MDTANKVKRQALEQEKIFANCAIERGILLSINKTLRSSTTTIQIIHSGNMRRRQTCIFFSEQNSNDQQIHEKMLGFTSHQRNEN